jgi:glutamine amidotransferase
MARICIVDYGVGNTHSALKAFRRFADDVLLSEDPDVVGAADALVLPGVGSFGAGMEGMRVRGLIDAVKRSAAAGKPVLGICLGAQLLLTTGHEFGTFDGLDLIPGDVVPFPPLADGCKTPHMGWNELIVPSGTAWRGMILDGLPPKPQAYFVHSFVFRPVDPSSIVAVTEYGGCIFPSVIRSGRVYGCQFHPEKSSEHGLHIIREFLSHI